MAAPASAGQPKSPARVNSELSKRRTTWEFTRTLLWKNRILKHRRIRATVLETVLPCLFVILLSGLKHLVDDVNVPAGWSDDNSSSGDDTVGTSYNLYQSTGGSLLWIPGDLPKFTQYETSVTGLLFYMALLSAQNGLDLSQLSAQDKQTCMTGVAVYGMVDTNTSSAYTVPSACDGRIAPYKLAIVPDTEFTRDYFAQTMELWYPRVNLLNSSTSPQIPSWSESVVFYESESALEDYVKSNDYGSGLDNPHIYGAIVFDTYPDASNIGSFESIEYTLRLNSTESDDDDIGLIPSTSGDPPQLSPLQKSIKTDYYTRYALTGFMTLQTLVTRFVSCMPDWDASSKSTTGECQQGQTTAESSTDLDERLLSTLENDAMISGALTTLGSYTSSVNETSFAQMRRQFSDATKEALLKPLRQAPQPYLGGTVAPFPVEAYIDAAFYDDISDQFAIILILGYMYPMSRVLVALIQEKQMRLREFIKILGASDFAITASWFITYSLMFLIGSCLQALACLIGLFANSSWILIFVFFFLFGLSVLSFAFMVSTIFSDARLGAILGMVLFLLMHLVASAFSTETPEKTKTLASLLSPVSFTFGLQTISTAESTGDGINFSNINVLSENFRFSTALLMFAVDAVLYSILGVYLDKIVPKQYGTSLKWYFPLSPAYWRGRRQQPKRDEALLDNVVLNVNPNFEPVNAELRDQERQGEVLSVQRLRKVFPTPGGEKVAVQGLNLTMYKNQITCLLGHNGAGKTTLISMLTGMTAPTSGNATFNGLTLTDDMDEIRQSLGICFQHDVLFPELTVEEHLIIFGRIKGYRDAELQTIVDTQIREVGLTEKRHVKSGELSGGMKRKLSVAISLLGDSSLVFLDEPTSGMDPYSRRSTWEILLNNRNDRVMVLTTHFMDEADILGDRIAIMAEGEVRCAGSSLFLKNRFGAGYNLTVVKDDAKCVDSNVISFVSSFVPSAQVLSNVGSEIAFQLPIDSSSQFAGMFARMDAEMGKMGLLSYGVSVTTLEEVFIKVAEMDDEGNQHTLSRAARVVPSSPVSSLSNTSEIGADTKGASVLTQLRALVLKRIRFSKRDRKSLTFSLIYPIVLILVGLEILHNNQTTSNDPALSLSTDAYNGDSTIAPFVCLPSGASGDWCSILTQATSYVSGATLQALSVDEPAFSSDSPTVFNVTYSDPTINVTDATGYELRLGQTLYERGYGFNGTDVLDQYGAYLLYGDSSQNIIAYNLMVNTTAAHSSVIFKSLMDQAVYRFFASNGSAVGSSSITLKVNNHPLPLTSSSKTMFGNTLAFTAIIFICIAFTYFTASIVVFLVMERQSEHNVKHQQLVSGVSLSAFWLANYIYDLLVYIVPFVAALILIKAFNVSTMTGSSECYSCTSATFPAVVVLFILFGFAICPFTYCLSYLFKDHASSQTYTVMINLIIGVVLMIVSYILDQIDSTESTNSVLKFFWRFSPLFDLGNGLLSLVLHEGKSIRSSSTTKTSPFSTDLMGYEMIYLVVLTCAYGCLAVAIDYALTFPRVKSELASDSEFTGHDDELDVDVKNEVERVARGDADGETVKLASLRKVYPGGKVAVRDLSFGLKRGECFGFLGINGAGKTTTMKMLTGDVAPTHGTATLGGYDILTQQMDVRREIGYCPQFDALLDKLTVREHLELFAAIKGISHNAVDAVVTEKIEQMNLADFENKLAGSLSGGNKRKLSVAIAMIGNPRIIFLDEPSTGMDPVSRRFMWDVIAGISTRGKASTIVLTTHSMEEAEALCSRVGIMVGGQLRCLGSTQHLKSRFGDGLVFDVKLVPPSSDELECLVQEVLGHHDDVVTRVNLSEKCRAFGNELLAQRVAPSHPTGYSLAAAFERDGFVRAEAFCSWCIEETRFDALHNFLQQQFGVDGVVVMERQNDFCRFKLRGSSSNLKLSKVFELIEGMKSSMYIREYSVSQTTLEQIFNSFASKQEEEQGVARGINAS